MVETLIKDNITELKFRNKVGLLGEFISLEDNDGKEFINAQFPEFKSKFPLKLIGDRYHLVNPHQENVVETKRTKYDEAERRRILLREYIRGRQQYSVDSFFPLEMSNPIRYHLRTLLTECKTKDFVFMGDARHPYALSNYDQYCGNKRGPFQIGLKPSEKYLDGVVYITPDIEIAIRNPDENEMYKDWDMIRFLYLIDSKGLFLSLPKITEMDLAANQIRTKGIASVDIRAVIVTQNIGYNGKILGIIENKMYRNT